MCARRRRSASLGGGLGQLDHLPEPGAVAPLGEAALGEALEVFLALLELEHLLDADALLDVRLLRSLARQDDEGLHDLGGVAGSEDEVLGLVEVAVDGLAALRMIVEHPLEMLHAVADVAGLALHCP